MEWIVEHEGQLRIGLFVGVLSIMALAEALAPRRRRNLNRGGRWFANLGLVVVDSVLLRIALPLLAVGAAGIAAANGWGLLALVDAPAWLAIVIGFIALDFAVWGQHVVTHLYKPLWALHQVHHADRDIDVTTGLRFHPIEILLSMIWKIVVVVALGVPAAAVILFEIVLNASAMFNHSNVRLPLWLDRVLRQVVVTPDMHRVHHSVINRETDSNYGFFLSVWDRWFRTYNDQPAEGHDGMTIGLSQYQTEKPASLLWCLILPFKTWFGKKTETQSS